MICVLKLVGVYESPLGEVADGRGTKGVGAALARARKNPAGRGSFAESYSSSPSSLRRNHGAGKSVFETEVFQEGVDTKNVPWQEMANNLRWFRYGVTHTAGTYLAVEEWENPDSKSNHRRKIAVFNVTSGEEMIGPKIDALREVGDLKNIVADLVTDLANMEVSGSSGKKCQSIFKGLARPHLHIGLVWAMPAVNL